MLRVAMAGQRSEIATQNGSVVHIRDVLRSSEAPPYLNFIREFGFNAYLFNGLLNGTHKVWASKPIYDGDYPTDKPVERITVRTTLIPDGKTIEATLVAPFAPSIMQVRLPKSLAESIGFEAILLQEGTITYDILQQFNQIAKTYKKKELISVTLEPGDLLLIPRSVARRVSNVVHGSTKYLYIGDPWTDNDKPVEITESA